MPGKVISEKSDQILTYRLYWQRVYGQSPSEIKIFVSARWKWMSDLTWRGEFSPNPHRPTLGTIDPGNKGISVRFLVEWTWHSEVVVGSLHNIAAFFYSQKNHRYVPPRVLDNQIPFVCLQNLLTKSTKSPANSRRILIGREKSAPLLRHRIEIRIEMSFQNRT